MATERKISPVKDNNDKARTYRDTMVRYNRAVSNEFYFEAMLIEYALLEDRLRSFIYHLGGFKNRSSHGLDVKKVKNNFRTFISQYMGEKEAKRIYINNITSKIKVISCTLQWACNVENVNKSDKYLLALKNRCESLDIKGILDELKELEDWCKYRNEVIHCLLNKNQDSLNAELIDRVVQGKEIANFIDSQVKILKKNNSIRKAAGLKQE